MASRKKAKPEHEHDLRFWGCQNPPGVMAACMPCGYHELLGDGLTLEAITGKTKAHQPGAKGDGSAVTLTFEGAGPSFRAIRAHGTGLEGAVYVGCMRRHVPGPGVARGWTAELWGAAGGKPEDVDGWTGRTAGTRPEAERLVRDLLESGGPWWV